MGKKEMMLLFILISLVSCGVKQHIVYGEKNTPTQVRYGEEWTDEDPEVQLSYRDTTQIMKYYYGIDKSCNLKTFEECEEHLVFTKHFQIETDSFFVHIREIGFGDSQLFIDVYKKVRDFWVLNTRSSAQFDFPISLKVDDKQKKIYFETPHNVIKELPFEKIVTNGMVVSWRTRKHTHTSSIY